MAEDTHRLEVPVRPDRREAVAAALWALGAEGLWEQGERTVAWFRAAPDDDHLAAHGALIPELLANEVRRSTEHDQDWQAAWKATIAPIRAGRTTVVPTWLAADHPAIDGGLTLVLDPGRAFGTGHHATTALCLELLDELDLDGGLSGHTLADIGCGSGILGIAAAARGARVQAVDIDPDAVAVTEENAASNRVALTTRVGSTGAIAGPVDVVVANLISDVVRDQAAALVHLTRRELLVSGITVERCRDVLDALTTAGCAVVEVRTRDGWIAARLRPAPERSDDDQPARARHRRATGGATAALVAVAVAAGVLAGCTTPEVAVPGEEGDTEEGAQPAPELDEDAQALAADVEEMVALVEEIRGELAAARTADTVEEATAALTRADALLVADAEAGDTALLPIEPAERTEARASRDALTELLTQARETGGSLGRSVVEALRDPVVGDLGAWELDAPGVVTGARTTGMQAPDVEAALDRILDLDGEATKAIAWIALGSSRTDLEQIQAAAGFADGHLEVVSLVLSDLVTAEEVAEDDGTEELGPVLEDPEDPEADG